MVSAVVLINAARGQVDVTGEQIAALPGVYEVFSVAGRVDLVALLRVRANDERLDGFQFAAQCKSLVALRVAMQRKPRAFLRELPRNRRTDAA